MSRTPFQKKAVIELDGSADFAFGMRLESPETGDEALDEEKEDVDGKSEDQFGVRADTTVNPFDTGNSSLILLAEAHGLLLFFCRVFFASFRAGGKLTRLRFALKKQFRVCIRGYQQPLSFWHVYFCQCASRPQQYAPQEWFHTKFRFVCFFFFFCPPTCGLLRA